MLEHLDQMDLQESTVRVDLLHLDPTDPDGGCAAGGIAAGPAAGGTATGRSSRKPDRWKHL